MKKSTRIIALLFSLLMVLSICVACAPKAAGEPAATEAPAASEVPSETQAPQAQNTKITIGCMPLNKDAVEAIKELLAPKGYDIDVMVFDGNNLPAEALKADEIDGLILNHLPWIKNFNAQNNAELTLVKGFTYASLFGLYSSKHASVEDLPENGTIIISNDPSNMDRSLRFLEKLGLITLGEKASNYYTVLDIKDNPKNLQLAEVETTNTAGSYKDADACISFSSVMRNAGYDASSYLAEDGDYVNYPTGLIVNKGEEEAQWAKDLVAVTQTPEFKSKFDDIFQGAYILFDYSEGN